MDFINMLNVQAQAIKDELEERISESKYIEDVYITHSNVFDKFNRKAFIPLTDKETLNKLDKDNMGMLMNDLSTDIKLIATQTSEVGNKFSNLYNSNQDYKTKLKNRVNDLISVISDTQILGNEYSKNAIVFRDSLTGYSYIDKNLTIGNACNISTSEGVAYLKVKSNLLVNNENTEIRVNPNSGEVFDPKQKIQFEDNQYVGNDHVAKIVSVKIDNVYENYIDYMSNDDSHNNLNSIIDNEANTWFEYQKLGLNDSDKKAYNIKWADAKKIGDSITFNMIIKLSENRTYDINWIDITPYLPPKSKANTKVTKISTSKDGAVWENIFSGCSEIYTVQQSHLSKDISGNKIISQGLYTFPKTQAKYIHFVFTQDIPYSESLVETIYYKSDVDPGVNIDIDEWYKNNATMINQSEITQNIITGPPGKYIIKDNLNNTKYIIKRNILLDGYRYMIGLRGIDIFKREFEETSSLVTTKFVSNKPIKKISLSASEYIPESFNKAGINMRNEWIKYYISLDDVNWHRISPEHHNPIGNSGLGYEEESFKIYEVNSLASKEEKNLYTNKGYLGDGKSIYGVRLKVVIKRPKELKDLTPILEEYALRIDMEE